ncbi:hypothetical protein N7468_001816 [Penicillium chermesinum]|uniref:Uncharacterized protein n=1 Tax=Penicillium chermesinum TaxID=63820 RepID=A0A9W9TXQ9_9EURO|nr:uncharacterized protein N7468_001816 [Penicillium chermesinum]KAJ5246833.1 hypothetical protein N7468_001816 [Penicillium chermesinum]
MPSLTLTDPDMILPFGGSERESSTPSPPSQLVYLSDLNARYNPNDPHTSSGAASAGITNTRPKKNFSRNWSHEDIGVANTRRLSDIGEELSPTRAEEFDKQPKQSQSAPQSSANSQTQLAPIDTEQQSALSPSSPLASAGSEQTASGIASPKLSHSISASPILAGSRNESPSQNEMMQAALPAGNAIASAAVTGKGPGDDFASAILSSEAERILDNAKKRLTLMEGNLNRARSTVRLTPSPSPSSPGYIRPINPNQPVGKLYRTFSRSDRRGSALRRQSFVPSQDALNSRHSRVQSDTNFPDEASLTPDAKRLSRSVSAMGVSTSSHFHDDRSFHYEPNRAYLTHRASNSSMSMHRPYVELPAPAQSPQPDQLPQIAQSSNSNEESSSESPRGLGISTESESKSSSSPVTGSGQPSPVYSSYGPPSRAQSQLQVRDLQYQMKGLHIKISSLKVKNQEDKMRRRSLQSLRTPSPLTAADPWYTNGLEMRDGRSSRGSNAIHSPSAYSRDYRNSRELASTYLNPYGNERKESPVDNTRGSLTKGSSTAWESQESAGSDNRGETTASAYEDAEQGDFEDGDIDREALDEILREPLDEDLESPMDDSPLGAQEREDAFDYEHFILHSALGNYSRHARHGSHHSSAARSHQRPRHVRNDSNISSGTDATFATATEGEQLPEEEDELMYWDRRFNHELRHHHDPAHDDVEIETDRSETPRGYREDESGANTPVEDPSQAHTARAGVRDSFNNGSATPTSLAESLVSTVRAASAPSPHRDSATPNSGGINHDDTQMLEQLFQSLGNVCMDLQSITTSPTPDLKAAKVLRRRLDAARRALDGELDA